MSLFGYRKRTKRYVKENADENPFVTDIEVIEDELDNMEECSIFDQFLKGDFEDKRAECNPTLACTHPDDECYDDMGKSTIDLFSDNLDGQIRGQERFVSNPEFSRIINEYFDIMHTPTRKALINLSESEQEAVLMNLTAKLYDKIVDKAAEVDFGEIPDTKGNIAALENYSSIKETLTILTDILNTYKQNPGAVDVVTEALANLEVRKDLFEKCYRFNIDLGILIYETIAVSITNGISYIIASCIEFIKSSKDDTFDIVFDKMQYVKAKDHLIYTNLDKFNKCCKKGDLDKLLGALTNKKVENLMGGGTIIAGVIGGLALITIALTIIPCIRELIYFFFNIKVKISDFFDVQANLLQMNAYNVAQNETIDFDKRTKISEKQNKIAERYRKISNKFAIDHKKSEVETKKEIDAESKYDVDSVDKSAPTSLF